MKKHAGFIVLVLTAAILLMPFRTYALSVREYENKTKQQRAEAAVSAIDKIVADVAKANPALSKAIHDYFYVVPEGQLQPPGLFAFEGDLAAVEDAASQGKLDLDKIQIEGILLGIVKRDVMPKQSAKDKPPSATK